MMKCMTDTVVDCAGASREVFWRKRLEPDAEDGGALEDRKAGH